MTNTTVLPCQGNCGGGFNLVEIHGNGNTERKYIIKRDCYQHDETHYTCADCYEKKTNELSNTNQSNSDSSQSKSANLPNQINNNSSSNNKPNTPLYIGLAIAGIALIGLVVYFLTKKREK